MWKAEENLAAEEIYENMREKYEKKFRRTRPKMLLESWLADIDREGSPELEKLKDMAVCYPDMNSFLEALLLGEEGDLKRFGGKTWQADAVHLMTLHGSKGLEFPVVILFGVGKGELPLENDRHPVDVKEERRLFYVGMTRAREELILTCPEEPSAFLEELPEAEISREKTGKRQTAPVMQQLSLFDFLDQVSEEPCDPGKRASD